MFHVVFGRSIVQLATLARDKTRRTSNPPIPSSAPSSFTGLSIIVAFCLYGVLGSVLVSMSMLKSKSSLVERELPTKYGAHVDCGSRWVDVLQVYTFSLELEGDYMWCIKAGGVTVPTRVTG